MRFTEVTITVKMHAESRASVGAFLDKIHSFIQEEMVQSDELELSPAWDSIAISIGE